MIGQYLSNTNKSTTAFIFTKKNLEVNKALVKALDCKAGRAASLHDGY